jgi:hypothetical protein
VPELEKVSRRWQEEIVRDELLILGERLSSCSEKLDAMQDRNRQRMSWHTR